MKRGTYIRTEEIREKNRLALVGYKHTEEARHNMSKSKMGNKNALGYKHSTKAKQKISKATKGSKNPMYGVHRYGSKAANWKGGRYKNWEGRMVVHKPDHPYARKGGIIYKSRLVMEKVLGRYLKREEVVHHINHIIDDDRPENLQLFPNQSEHMKLHNKINQMS